MNPRQSLSRVAAIAASLVFALAACSSPVGDEEAADQEAPSAAAEASTQEAPAEDSSTEKVPVEDGPSDEVSAEPVDSGLSELELGEAFTTDNGSEITAHEIRLDIPYDFESDDGGGWHAIDVSYCLSDTLPETTVFQDFAYGWILRTEEGYVLDYPSSSWDNIVSPTLDLYHVSPAAGECYRGWVLIDGPAGANVTSARFYEVDWAVETS